MTPNSSPEAKRAKVTTEGQQEPKEEKQQTTSDVEKEAADKDNACPVCLSDITDLAVALPCGHSYDKECLETALTNDGRCPKCRAAVGEMRHGFKADGTSETKAVADPGEQAHAVSPDVVARFVRHDGEATRARLIVTRDAVVVVKRGHQTSRFPMTAGQSAHLISILNRIDTHVSVQMEGSEDVEVHLPNLDSDSEDDDDGPPVNMGEVEIAASNGILRVLQFLQQQLAADVTLSGAVTDADDQDVEMPELVPPADAGHLPLVPRPQAGSSSVVETISDSGPASQASTRSSNSAARSASPDEAMDTPQPVPSAPPTEDIRVSASSSIVLSFQYPNGPAASFTASSLLLLRTNESQDHNSIAVRSGDLVLMPPGLLLRSASDVVVREAGHDVSLSAPFRDVVQAMDQAHAYTRQDSEAGDDEDSDDSSDSDDDDGLSIVQSPTND